MATSERTLRRGLPRRHGGDLWPPAGVAVPGAVLPTGGDVARRGVDVAGAAVPAGDVSSPAPSVVAVAGVVPPADAPSAAPAAGDASGVPPTDLPPEAQVVERAATPRDDTPGETGEAGGTGASSVGRPTIEESGSLATIDVPAARSVDRPLRRGLPRARGGEPWPPAGIVPVAVTSSVVASAVAGADDDSPLREPRENVAPQQVSGAGSAEGDGAAHGAMIVDDAVAIDDRGPAVVQGAVTSSTPTAGAPGPAAVLRRGLPRTRGGEPWPPVRVVPVAASESAAVTTPVTTAPAGVAAAAGPRTASPGAAGTAEREASASAAAEAPRRTGGGATGAETPAPDAEVPAEGTPLRRGLPRARDGEPWPPAGLVPARTSAELLVSAVPAPESAAGIDAVPTVPDAALVASTGPAASATGVVAPAASETEAVVPAVAEVAATEPVPPRAPSEPQGPLPFRRTVWPGAAASARPVPASQPRRIGPFTRGQWAGAVVVGGAALLYAAAMAVVAVRWLISLEPLQEFLATYPGEYHLPDGAPVGLPGWLGWQHFFNVFLMVLIIRSGLRVRTEKRPTVFWTPRRDRKGKISLTLWFHQALDVLWLVNGLVFVVLLFATGQWMRIVPTSWEVFPNALSAVLQYVSLDWPTENGWVNYNSLQQLAYFTTVFVAAPLAAVTGYRMSGLWPKKATALNRAYPVEWARALHFPVMLYFVAFIVVHVTLVFATGALRNLNHMYAGQDAVNWTGFWIFFASMVVVAAGWVAARPLLIAPLARLFGTVGGR